MISLQVNVKSFKEKCVVKVFGYEMILRSEKKGNLDKEEEVNEGKDEAEAENDKDKEADEGDTELIIRTEILLLKYLFRSRSA